MNLEEVKAYARQQAEFYGFDPEIMLRQIGVESGWNPNAVSPAGAKGLAQFMDETWARYGQGSPFDPYAAIDARMLYMNDLRTRYHGDTRLAAAAYNAGEGHVDKYLQGKSILPQETVDYLAAIFGGGPVPEGSPGVMMGIGPDSRRRATLRPGQWITVQL